MLYQPQSCDNVTHLGSSSNMPRAGNSDRKLFLATERL